MESALKRHHADDSYQLLKENSIVLDFLVISLGAIAGAGLIDFTAIIDNAFKGVAGIVGKVPGTAMFSKIAAYIGGWAVNRSIEAMKNKAGALLSLAGTVASGPIKAAARAMLIGYGWNPITQFPPLDALWTRESNWNPLARNPSSGAYGIPQALPAGKMATAGPDWAVNPITQIRWGLSYIKGRYGSPAACEYCVFPSSLSASRLMLG